MQYTDIECKEALENDVDKIESYCLIDTYEGSMNYSISVIREGVLFDCLISKDDLSFACINFLIRNGAPVYKNINEFKEKNPGISC